MRKKQARIVVAAESIPEGQAIIWPEERPVRWTHISAAGCEVEIPPGTRTTDEAFDRAVYALLCKVRDKGNGDANEPNHGAISVRAETKKD